MHNSFCIVLLFNSFFFAANARPLSNTILKAQSIWFLDWSSLSGLKDGRQTLQGIKVSGPSPGGGHEYTNKQTPGGIKVSGPSPGAGHGKTDEQTLGGIKVSGPSPGAGHGNTNSQTLGGIKVAGPTPGAGHGHTTGQTLGGIKDSGLCFRVGCKSLSYTQN